MLFIFCVSFALGLSNQIRGAQLGWPATPSYKELVRLGLGLEQV
jgi:hypothetical protein